MLRTPFLHQLPPQFRDLLVIVGMVGIATVFVLLAIGGAVRVTAGGSSSWQAIGALASVGSMFVTIIAVGTLGIAIKEFEARTQDTRASRMPYLRIDLGFHPEDAVQPGFYPSPARFIFNHSHFGNANHEAPGPLRPLEGGTLGQRRLVLWVTNLQNQPLGTAYNVQVTIVLSWGQGADEFAFYTLDFSYVAPGATTAVQVLAIRRDIEQFHASVAEVLYGDMEALGRRYIDHHGATTLTYDRRRGASNGRSFEVGQRKETKGTLVGLWRENHERNSQR